MTTGTRREVVPEPGAGDALVVVDLQRDFLPGGALGVAGGDEVVVPINRWVETFHRRGLPIVASRDWHTADHCSFSAQGGPWPPHCVAGTPGAELTPRLELPAGALLISKGTAPERDAYSAFDGTGLAGMLRERGVSRVFVAGLATDYCVAETAVDARRLGFEAVLIEEAVRAVDATPGDGERAVARMREAGCLILDRPRAAAGRASVCTAPRTAHWPDR